MTGKEFKKLHLKPWSHDKAYVVAESHNGARWDVADDEETPDEAPNFFFRFDVRESPAT